MGELVFAADSERPEWNPLRHSFHVDNPQSCIMLFTFSTPHPPPPNTFLCYIPTRWAFV